jgi:hypothetical protein
MDENDTLYIVSSPHHNILQATMVKVLFIFVVRGGNLHVVGAGV